MSRPFTALATCLFLICASDALAAAPSKPASDTAKTLQQWPIGQDLMCHAGSSLDADTTKSIATAKLTNAKTGETKWVMRQPAPAEYFQNRFSACAGSASAVFLLEQVDTQASAALRRTLFALRKVDAIGRVLIRQPISIDISRRAWSIALAQDAQHVHALLGARKEQGDESVGSMRLVSFSPDLKGQTTLQIQHGSFLQGTRLWATDNGFYVIGPFAKTGLDADAEIAVAKLSPSGKYIWSTRLPLELTRPIFNFDAQTKTIKVSGQYSGQSRQYTIDAKGEVTAY